MRLSAERIRGLQALLRELGLDYTDEQTQEAGLAIMRFTLAKMRRQQELNSNGDEQNGRRITE